MPIRAALAGSAFWVCVWSAIAEESAIGDLEVPTIDLPPRYELDSRSGMRAVVHEHKDGVDVLLCFYGEQLHGGARLSRILMCFTRRGSVLCLANCQRIFFDGPPADIKTVDCLNGFLILDRKLNKIELSFVVLHEENWHRFGWNGIWSYSVDPAFDREGILENMRIPRELW